MSSDTEVRQILVEIRDNQRESLRRQEEHLDIARKQLERSNTQISESIELQKEAVAKARQIGRVALPAVFLCIALVIYLIVRYL